MHSSKTNPSFSSTLLDEIYNSIDSKPQKTKSFVGSLNSTTKKQSIVTKSVSDHKDRFFSSLSSSSDSNSSLFSSSDTETTHTKKTTSSRPLCFGPSKTKVTKPRKTEDHQNRATRVYNDYDYTRSRKPKTPASAGGRIVNFLNSLFSNNSKQSNSVKSYPRKTKNDDHSYTTCSSASSFSRSYMNKRYEKSSDHIRISRVNVIVPEKLTIRTSMKKNVEDGGRRSVEEILRDYQKNHENSLIKKNNGFEDYEDDDVSDSSSDLFELDLVRSHHHHNVYEDELPVFESTFAGLIL